MHLNVPPVQSDGPDPPTTFAFAKMYFTSESTAFILVTSHTGAPDCAAHVSVHLYSPVTHPLGITSDELGQLVPTKLAPVKVKDRATLCSAIVDHPVVTEVILGKVVTTEKRIELSTYGPV